MAIYQESAERERPGATQALLDGSGVTVPEIGTRLFDAYAAELRRQRYFE